MPHCARAFLEIHESVHDAAQNQSKQPSFVSDELGKIDDHSRERGQVGTEALEQVFECRDHEDHQYDCNHKCDDNDRRRIGQSFLDLLLDGFGFFLVRCNLLEQRFECAGLLAGFDKVDEQIVKI
jgi:hypothetical protein